MYVLLKINYPGFLTHGKTVHSFSFTRLPDKLSVTWPEGDELLPNETKFAGTPIGIFFLPSTKN